MASATRPSAHATCMALHKAGAILPVTLMQPWPPDAMKASAVWSSPDNWLKSGPQAAVVCSGRVRLAVASFTPTILRCFASRAIVSTLISTTLNGQGYCK